MRNHPLCPAPAASSIRPERGQAGPTKASPEQTEILAGVQAGDAALARFRSFGVLTLFMEARRCDQTPALAALRAYAELRRVLLADGHDVPAASLAAVGFTAAQIARFNRAIATTPSSTETKPEANMRPDQSEIVQ